MRKTIFILLVILRFQNLTAQKILTIKPHDEDIEVINNLSYYLDSTGQVSIYQILSSDLFRPLSKNTINFGRNQSYLWLKLRIINQSNSDRVFSLISKGVDSLQSYQVSEPTSQILKNSLTGSHISLNKREFMSPYLSFSFKLSPNQVNVIYVRAKNNNYPLSVYPFKLFTQDSAKFYIKRKDLLQSIYIGSMVFLLLFGSVLLSFFKEWLYFYYLLCVLFSMTMMLVYNDYYYLIFEQAPLIIRNKNFYGIPTSLLPLFYLFFAKEFLVFGYDVNGYLKRLIRVTSILTVCVLVIFLAFNISIYQYRIIFYVCIFALCTLTLVLLFRSIRRKYKPAWLFLFATVPVLLMGFWETLSDLHHTPVQEIHSYYYFFTIFEMYMLTLGLSLKFKIAQDEKKKLQAEVFAIETQVQENERQRIAQDIHDKIGGLLGALYINLSVLTKNKNLGTEEVSSIQKSLKMLDLTSEEVRGISHSLASNTLTKLGLVAMLIEMYEGSDSPKVSIQNNGFLSRLSPTKEMASYAIIQECINNARKHADAKNIYIVFKQIDEKLLIMIEDDGNGFDIRNLPKTGTGLENIGFRVKEHLQGDLSIDTDIGQGTTIMIKIKLTLNKH